MGERASILLAVMIIAGASLPSAHADMNENAIYQSATLCASERATLDSGTDSSGRAGADIYSWTNDGGSPCAKAHSLDPAYLAQQVWIYYRDPTTGDAGLCAYTEWYYNESKVAHFGIFTDAVAAICGTGDYKVLARGAIGVQGQWQPGNASLNGWQRLKAPGL